MTSAGSRAVHDGLFEVHDDGTHRSHRRVLAVERQVPLPAPRRVPVLGRGRRRTRRCCRVTARSGRGPRSPPRPRATKGPVPYGFGIVELDPGTPPHRHPPHRGGPGGARLRPTDDARRRRAARRSGDVGVRVEVAGVGIHPFGRFDDLTNTDMGVHAVRAALAEAGEPAVPGGVLRHRVRRRRVGPQGARRARPHRDADRRRRGRLRERRRRARSSRRARSGPGSTTACSCSASRRCRRASSARRSSNRGARSPGSPRRRRTSRCGRSGCSASTGLTKDDLAAVVVKNRRHGVDNPNAMFRKEVTADEVLASRLVCEPLHLWMLCSPNEGAAAVVLRRAGGDRRRRDARVRRDCARTCPAACSARRRRSRASTTPTSSRRRRSPRATRTTKPASDPTTSTSSSARTPTRHASSSRITSSACARRASRPASSPTARSRLGGARPVNPSGGLLSKGEPLGASGARSGRRARAPAPRRSRRPPGRRRARRPRAHRRPRRQRLLRDRARTLATNLASA